MREESIFIEALEREDPAERAAFLDRACAEDPDLRQRIERLLGRHGQSDEWLDAPSPWAATVDAPVSEGIGTVIGPYRLMEAIGEGGMGVVYVAEQHQPLRRKVALKVIKPGMDTKQVVARFEAERQALAMMDHPNIAKVHDGGATDSGRPYFVMELVRGLPITEYCDRERLSIRERLELFVLVCRAVQHAHQKGVIHRDLKPSNIMVTLHDGVPVPKVIDFGVAKATGQALTEKTIYTAFAQLVGTPLYMSPEQVELSGLDVDTRSDIYSLGALLYELLTGTTPFDSEALRKAAFDEMRRIIREEEPQRPSYRLSSLGETLTTVSVRRRSDPRRLGPSLRGELDWVVMKALEKDRRRRYETANDFADDVMRHLTDRPVEACPPSRRYRFAKYARRNRATLTTTVLVAVALAGGTAISVHQAARARQAAEEARLRAEESRQVVDYLVSDIFSTAAPESARLRSLTPLDLLYMADENLADRFGRQPLVEASIRMALARSYHTMWNYGRAAWNAAHAASLRERHLGPEHSETLDALDLWAWAMCLDDWPYYGTARDAAVVAQRTYSCRRRLLGPGHPETLRSQSVLALSLAHAGSADEAKPLQFQAESIALRTLGPEDPLTLTIQHFLVLILNRAGEFDRGESLGRRTLAARDRILGPLHPDTLDSYHELGAILAKRGHNVESKALLRESLDRRGRVFGYGSIFVSGTLSTLTAVLRKEGAHEELRDLYEHLIRKFFATRAEPGRYLGSRRSIQLVNIVLGVATLPDEVPFDPELAVRAAEEAVSFNECWDIAWISQAAVHYRLGRLNEAMRAIETAMAQPEGQGDDALLLLILALIHARRGEPDRARAWYDKVRTLDPQADDALRDRGRSAKKRPEEPFDTELFHFPLRIDPKEPFRFYREEVRIFREEAKRLIGP